jgi:hypothetical protein
MKYLLISLISLFISCNTPKDNNNLGLVEKLPPGEYIIWNHGSRHIVKCLMPNGKYYYLSDANFSINNIEGYDAHQYRNKTKIIVK